MFCLISVEHLFNKPRWSLAAPSAKAQAQAQVMAACLLVAACAAVASDSEGFVHVQSAHSVEDTVERARRMMESQGLRVFGIIDHQAAARPADESLLPTRVLVFGNPALGAQLMREHRLIAHDLPMRLLVWEDDKGVVWISYLRAEILAQRHGFAEQDKRLTRIARLLKDLARAAAR